MNAGSKRKLETENTERELVWDKTFFLNRQLIDCVLSEKGKSNTLTCTDLPMVNRFFSFDEFNCPQSITEGHRVFTYIDQLRREHSDVQRPAPFIYTNSLVYKCDTLVDDTMLEQCNCWPRKRCSIDDECINRILHIECTDDCCPVIPKEKCVNRRFQQLQWKQVSIRNVGKRGWGLFVDEFVEAGDLILEYVGEVITKGSCEDRLSRVYSKDRHFYMLTLDSNSIIDATRVGGEARFVNHSCSPNAEVQKWNVAGSFRIGIFATMNLSPNSEVSMDYRFKDLGTSRQECHCGSRNCRKFLGAKALSSSFDSTCAEVSPTTVELASNRRSKLPLPLEKPQKIKKTPVTLDLALQLYCLLSLNFPDELLSECSHLIRETNIFLVHNLLTGVKSRMEGIQAMNIDVGVRQTLIRSLKRSLRALIRKI